MANTGWSTRKRKELQNYATGNSPVAFTTIFGGLDTNTAVADDASNVVAGTTEPTSSNGYARFSITAWNASTTPSANAAATTSNSTPMTWTSSGGGFSTGATTLKSITLWTTATLATVTLAAFEGWAPIAVPQAVNATGITLTVANGGMVLGLISA